MTFKGAVYCCNEECYSNLDHGTVNDVKSSKISKEAFLALASRPITLKFFMVSDNTERECSRFRRQERNIDFELANSQNKHKCKRWV
jgi:hypothetical protein